jgi:PTS system mannose-specific IIA component
MIGLLVIAHAPLANALLECARHVYGPEIPHCAALDVPAKADPTAFLAEARALHAAVDRGAGVLVLTDMFGATPSNIAAQLARPSRTAVLTGVNLPMLLRTLNYRAEVLLDVLVEKACLGGTNGVMRVGPTVPQHQKPNLDNTAAGAAPLPPDPDDANTDALSRHHHQQ